MAVDILIELPRQWRSTHGETFYENMKLFMWLYTTAYHLLIYKNIPPDRSYPKDTNKGLLQIFNSIDPEDARLVTKYCRDNGIHQIDTLMRILPFLTFPGMDDDSTDYFCHHAMLSGLEYYMHQIGIYSVPPGEELRLRFPLTNQNDITIPEIDVLPRAIHQPSTIHYLIYTYVKRKMSTSKSSEAQKNIERNKKIYSVVIN